MIVLAVVLIAILIFLRSWLARPSSSHEMIDEPPTVQLGEEHLPKGLTVKDYIDQLLNEQFAYMKKEHEESKEQVQVDHVEKQRVEVQDAQQEAEEQAQVEAIEIEKMAQEEEVLKEETESERQKDVFEQVKEFAETDPGATADVLRTWLADGDGSTSGTDSADSEDSEEDEGS
jgi:L-fucose isomerase-like protein